MRIISLVIRALTHFNMGMLLAIPMWLGWHYLTSPATSPLPPNSVIGERGNTPVRLPCCFVPVEAKRIPASTRADPARERLVVEWR